MHCGFIKMLFSTFHPCLPTRPRGLIWWTTTNKWVKGEKWVCTVHFFHIYATYAGSVSLQSDDRIYLAQRSHPGDLCSTHQAEREFSPAGFVRERTERSRPVNFPFPAPCSAECEPSCRARRQSCRCGLLVFFSASLMASGVPVKTHTKAD